MVYYKRIISLIQRVELKDRQIFTLTPLSTFTSIKSTILNTVIRTFIRDLINPEIRIKVTRTMTSGDRLLRIIYNLIKKARRINIKI